MLQGETGKNDAPGNRPIQYVGSGWRTFPTEYTIPGEHEVSTEDSDERENDPKRGGIDDQEDKYCPNNDPHRNEKIFPACRCRHPPLPVTSAPTPARTATAPAAICNQSDHTSRVGISHAVMFVQ